MRIKRVLIADDDTNLIAALRARCEAMGLHVFTAVNALDALNLTHEAEPDLVCLDVNMPSGNGLCVLEMLANDGNLCSTPVIIMTGDASEETIRHCYDRCAYYVEKCSDVWSRIEPLINNVLDLKEKR